MGQTLFDKVWNRHVLYGKLGEPQLLYIDLHLIHEVTSPQAFEGLRLQNRKLRRPDLTFATLDHNVPTIDIFNIKDEIANKQITTLQKNAIDFGVHIFDMGSDEQGIVHMVGPETGLTQPGKTIVCGDSHTATHGAFGAIAFGIGTSEVEHVFATQTLWQTKPKNLKIDINGTLPTGVYAKDIILHLIKTYGVDFGTGYALEFTGETIKNLSMDGRMTICNMAIEGGAKYGIIQPDDITFEYVKGRPFADNFVKSVDKWRELYSDDDAIFDRVIELDVSTLEPQVTWGTNPEMGVNFSEPFPEISDINDQRAYDYMGLEPGQKAEDIDLGYVFLGSCTNARLSDLIEASHIVKGNKVHPNITAIVVPGSRTVKKEAEKLGLDTIFKNAGFEWREPGCSMCLGMNPDQVPEGVHCASTSNRNFEGRQGKGARTHLVSPAMAAAAAIHGKFVDGASVARVGDITFEIAKENVDDYVQVDEGAVCSTILDMYSKQAIVAEPAGALSVSALENYKDHIKGKTVVCVISGGNNDINRMKEIEERSLLYEEMKHYFILNFPQRPGALREFVNDVLGPQDDITKFEYLKKSSQNTGTVIIGIQLKDHDDLIQLKQRVNHFDPSNIYINENKMLYSLLI
ncbi:TPA: 3-isopropylmalate dehydratase large subunit [Staphylococcus aureus]|nr:3-isopropylmalate dehydratase large subunit [Staphylococcus aureus]